MRFDFTTLLAASGALAAPFVLDTTTESPSALVARGEALAPDTAKCLGYRNSFWDINQSIFQITIGRPYLGGSRCGLIEDKVAKFFHVDGLTCKGAKDNKNTVIQIKSNMDDKNLQNINKGLKNAYPEISFDCPDNALDMQFPNPQPKLPKLRSQGNNQTQRTSIPPPPPLPPQDPPARDRLIIPKEMDHQTATDLLASVPYIHLFQTTLQLSPKSILRAKLRVLDKQHDELSALPEAEWTAAREAEWQVLLRELEAGEWLEEEMERERARGK
ncbi:hypothetical protein BST61_g2564 [Cercospora zeina]